MDEEVIKEEQSGGIGKTIMVVDDEDYIREACQEILENYKYKVLVADSGKKAFQIFDKEKDNIDLIILDIGMPEMDGFTCLNKFLKIKEDIKVIVSSGFMEDDKVSQCLNAGATGFIKKPYHFKEFLRMIKKII